MFSVYVHTNIINNKKYVGITSRNPKDRWYNGKGYNHNEYFTSAINKYGWDNFNHDILYTGLTEQEACLKEQELIALYKSNQHNYGYNLESGGKYFKVNDLTKKKISKSLKGRVITDEIKQKISNSEKGKLVSEETRKKISEANKRRFKDPNERYKCGNSTRGKHFIHSELHNKHVAEALRGKKYIHRGSELKYIKPEDLDYYLSQGWKLGKKDKKQSRPMSEIKKGGHWICDRNNKTKYVNSSDLVLYLQQGWQRGRKFKTNNS